MSGHRWRARLVASAHARALLLLALIALARPVAAQVAVEQHQAAPLPEDGFSLARPNFLAPSAWTLLVSGDYANDPLHYRTSRTPSTRQRVISHHLVVQLAGAWGVHRKVTLYAGLPIHALMRGDAPLLLPNIDADGASVGDFLLAARVALLGEATSTFALAGELLAHLPTAELFHDGQRYAGDEIGSYDGALVGEVRRGRFDARLRIGARLRRPQELLNLELGQALLFGLGARVRLPLDLTLHAELVGSTYWTRAFEQGHTPLELLVGAKYRRVRTWFGVAAGLGLIDGYGSPDFRVLAQLGFWADMLRPDAVPGQ